MSDINLFKGEVRESTGKASAKTARRNGMIPCIVYGDKQDPVSISINYISALIP